MSFAQLPTLGVGLGFREPLLSDLFLQRGEVDFLEITADHYLQAPPDKERELELLAAHFTLVPHGLNLSLGSAEGINEPYLQQLVKLIRRLEPPWWSEHLCFTRAGGIDIGHLSPLPWTHEAIDAVVRNIGHVRRHLDIPLILENITYDLMLPGAEMKESQFLAEILERTDCGLLLDVTNLHTNAINHGFDALDWLENLPLERVVQLHFSGGEWHDGFLIDSHAQPAPREVWSLLEEIVARTAVKGIILERDENLPPFGELVLELRQARAIGRKCGRWD